MPAPICPRRLAGLYSVAILSRCLIQSQPQRPVIECCHHCWNSITSQGKQEGKVDKKAPEALAEQLPITDYRMSKFKLAPG